MSPSDEAKPHPTLQTKRLALAIPELSDAQRLIDYGRRNDAAHAPWSPPLAPDAYELPASEARVARMHREWQEERSARFWFRSLDDPKGPFLGAVSLSRMCLGPFRCAGVGYHVDREHEGLGLVSEALRGVVDFAFSKLKLHRLEANFVPTNERSARVLERAGFTVEGYARRYLFIGGRLRDHVLTSLTNPALDDPEAFLALMHPQP